MTFMFPFPDARNGCITDEFGTQKWYRDGKLHRKEGPAVICKDGSWDWYQNGLLHREDGPAKNSNGSFSWYQNGKLHREDGPAIRSSWWCKGIYVGEQGTKDEELFNLLVSMPVLNGRIIDARGVESWYKGGLLHREDGPAQIWSRKDLLQWYYEGKYLGKHKEGFWELWKNLSEEEKTNANLLKFLPLMG